MLANTAMIALDVIGVPHYEREGRAANIDQLDKT